MQDEKTEIANEILMKIYPEVEHEVAKKLEAIIYISLAGYDITKKTTELVLYEGDITEDLLKRFIIAKKLKNCSDRTLKYYMKECRKVFEKIEKSPLDVTVDDIRMHFLRRQVQDKVSDTTINNERRALSSFFGWMATEEIRPTNPMLKVDALKEKIKKKEVFTEYELEKMRISIKDKKDKAIFEVLVSTWARVSEIANIKIEEIKGDQIIVHGKGNKDRNVFLTPRAQLAIEEYLKEREDDNCYLFPQKEQERVQGTKKGWWKDKEWVDPEKHTDVGTIECFIRKLGRKNQIKAHPHKFRRTGATMALRKGMPLMTVSKTLGHESIATTQIYLSIDDTELNEAHKKYC